MVIISIAGLYDCPLFAHMDYIADHLQRSLPEFSYKRKMFSEKNWANWLRTTNIKHGWRHITSPLVWKEIEGSKKMFLIGGASEFWEYVNEFYGVQSVMSEDQISQLVEGNTDLYIMTEGTESGCVYHYVSITGAGHPMTIPLIKELLVMTELAGSEGTIITIQDTNCELSYLEAVALQLEPEVVASEEDKDNPRRVVAKCHTDETFLSGCDLLIVMDDYRREDDEDLLLLLKRARLEMLALSAEINAHAPRRMRVVVGPTSLGCFLAHVLVIAVGQLHKHNIVAVTSHIGLSILPVIAELTDTPMADMGSPPVWGYVPISQLIDIANMVHSYERFVPNIRAITAKEGDTLPTGEFKTEVRRMGYLLHHITEIWTKVQMWKENHEDVVRYTQLRALLSLIRMWYTRECKEEIISLGVITDESFNLPPDIVFSQPCSLKDGIWKPVKGFPTPKDICSVLELANSATYIQELLSRPLPSIENNFCDLDVTTNPSESISEVDPEKMSNEMEEEEM